MITQLSAKGPQRDRVKFNVYLRSEDQMSLGEDRFIIGPVFSLYGKEPYGLLRLRTANGRAPESNGVMDMVLETHLYDRLISTGSVFVTAINMNVGLIDGLHAREYVVEKYWDFIRSLRV